MAADRGNAERPLRRALALDAIATGATALLLVTAGGALAGPLALPASLLRGSGAALVPYVLLVGLLARAPSLSRGASWAVVGCNAAWVAASVLLVESGAVSPSALGVAFVLAQAAAVAGLTALQVVALRSGAAAAVR